MPSTRKKVNGSPKKAIKKTKTSTKIAEGPKSKKRKLSESISPSIRKERKTSVSSDTQSADSSEVEEVEVTKDTKDHNYYAVKTLDAFPEDGYEPLPISTKPIVKPNTPKIVPNTHKIVPNLLKKTPKVVVQPLNEILKQQQEQKQIQIEKQHEDLKQILQQKQLEAQLQQKLQQKRKEIQIQRQKQMQAQELLKSRMQRENNLVMVNTDRGVVLVPKDALKSNKSIATNVDSTEKPNTSKVALLPPQLLNPPKNSTPVQMPKITPVQMPKITPVQMPKMTPVLAPKITPVLAPKITPVQMPQIPPLIDLTNDYKEQEHPVPKNLKIDFVNGNIVVDSEVFKIECFDTKCPDGKVRVTVAASGQHPKRTIVLKKLPPELSLLLAERWNTSRTQTPVKDPLKTKESPKTKEPSKISIFPTNDNQNEFERHVPETVVDGSEVNCIVVGGKKYKYVPNEAKKPVKVTKVDEDLIKTQLVLDELSKALDSDVKDSETSSISLKSAMRSLRSKPKHIVRWTDDDKLTALSIYKYSPQRYKSLQPLFSLPSKKVIALIIRNVRLSEGINQKFFSILKYSLKYFSEKDKICSLSFDVVVQTGRNKLTEYALIFVLNGLNKQWEQPIANFVEIKQFEPNIISDHVKEVISAIETIGISIICTVCNVKLFKVLKFLGSTLKNPSFVLNGKTRYTLLDFKDLLINIRNEFFNHDLKMGVDLKNDVAKWQHIREVVLFDNINTYKHIQGINDSCLEFLDKNTKNKFTKSRKILSYKLGSSLNSFTVSGNLDRSGMTTANFAIKMNEVFDSFLGNSNTPKGLKGLNCILDKTRESLHLNYWSSSLQEISEWKFLKDNKNYNSRVLISLLIVLKVLPLLWESLKTLNFETFNLNKLSIKSLNNYVERALDRNAKLKRDASFFSILTLELKHKTESNMVDMMFKQNDQINPDDQMYKILTQYVSSPTFYQNIFEFGSLARVDDSSDSSDSDG